MKIKPELSHSLQVANLIATLLVIAIHYTSKFGAGVPGITGDISLNFYFQEWFTNNLARVAVPFFAFSSGFFLFLSYSGNNAYTGLLKKRWKTLLLPYALASALIYLTVIARKLLGGNDVSGDIIHHLYHILILPKAGQFWFLRDLILLVLLTPLILLFVNISKGLILIPVFLLWLFEVQLLPVVGKWYVLNIETLFFFMLGCYISSRKELLEHLTMLNSSIFLFLLLLWLSLSAIRVYIDPVFSAWYQYDYTMTSLLLYKSSILLGIPVLIIVATHRVFRDKRILFLSGFTFFAYMFHTEPIHDVIVYLVGRFIMSEYVFYFSYPMATIMVFFGAWFCEKFLPRIYLLLTGNRGTAKVLSRQ